MKRATAIVAVAVLLALGGCTKDKKDAEATPPVWVPNASPSASAPAPAATESFAPPARPANGVYQSVSTPCPTVGERSGAKDDSSDTSTSATVDCAYGDQTQFPKVASKSTIHKAGNPKGKPATLAKKQFATLRATIQAQAKDGITIKSKQGIGDEALFVISFKDNVAQMFVRSGNAIIQTSAKVNARGDREAELTELQGLEQTVTDLARAQLAQLR
jgi:hypothetical protein